MEKKFIPNNKITNFVLVEATSDSRTPNYIFLKFKSENRDIFYTCRTTKKINKKTGKKISGDKFKLEELIELLKPFL